MRRLLSVTIATAMLACGCGEKEGAGGNEWPGAMKVSVKPSGKLINAGQKAEIVITNNTGLDWEVAWACKDNCKGEFIRKKSEPYAVRYVGSSVAADCTEEISVTLSREGQTLTKTFSIVVAADPDKAVLELDPKDRSEWKTINDFDETLEPKDIECKRTKKKAVEDEEGKKTGVEETVVEIIEGATTNNLGGHFNAWGYEYGICKFVDVPEGEERKGVAALEYYLPQLNSYCGYADHFRTGEDCVAERFDLSAYEKITFKLKSGDGAAHYPLFEIVGWSQFADAHQGAWEASKPLEAPAGEWRRYELNVLELIKDPKVIDPKEIKSIGFRINQAEKLKDGSKLVNGNEGIILIDDLALIRKPAAN
ncbi:MAG: hypothetical protein FJ098_16220 [Deltaproteobacteria bacterium]|nr:hypothetical protein [Deltaproteobacteria bacterium]